MTKKRTYNFNNWKIVDDGGWDLNTLYPDSDFEFLEKNIKIPVNMGLGIKAIHDRVEWITDRHEEPTVTLEISTWKGMSFNTMHYYGKLKVSFPEMMRSDPDKHGWTTSCSDIPLFDIYSIELTHILEQWEIEKYPGTYDSWRVGRPYRGFYGPKTVEIRGREIFEKVFGEGWIFKVIKRY